MSHAERNIYIIVGFGVICALNALFIAFCCPKLSDIFGMIYTVIFIGFAIASIIYTHVSGKEMTKKFDKLEQLLKSEKTKTEEGLNAKDEEKHPCAVADEVEREYARKKLLKSVSKGREFCMSMLKICLTATSAYIALLQYTTPEANNQQILLPMWLPLWMFFFSAVMLTLGATPGIKDDFSPDTPVKEITEMRQVAIKNWKRGSLLGLISLGLAVGFGLLVLSGWHPCK